MSTPRVVSLVPSATESLIAMGCTPVACTRFCEQPELAHVGGTKDPDVESIRALAPDLVVVDTEENRREDHDALVAAGITVIATSIRDIGDVDPAMGELADAVGARWRPLGTIVASGPPRAAVVAIWRRPWMWLGVPTYASSLLAALGVRNLIVDAAYPEIDPATVARLGPDLVVAPSEPYPFGERQRDELESIAAPWFVDGRDLFWWGARTRGAVSRLAEELSSTAPQGPGRSSR